MKVWAYVNDKGILCCALLKEAVPEGINAIELEVDNTSDVMLDNGDIRLKTIEEKLKELKEEKLRQLKPYVANLLSQTDYVLLKIQEAQTLGEDINTLLQKHKPILDKRKAIRDWYDKVKQDILNANTVEELEAIKLEFMG